jgi:transposase InsO family protein
MTRRLPLQRPRLRTLARSLPRTVVDARVVPLVAARVTASGDAELDQLVAAFLLPSQLLTIELLRRPPEFAQYTSKEFTDLLAEHEIAQSFSRPRQCWDNAVAESFFATLKLELIHRRPWATRDQARGAVFEFIEVFYNRRRLHSSLGYLTPADYECNKVHLQSAAHAA